MSSRHKRRLEEIDAEEANASDPEDSDFELTAPRTRPVPGSASKRRDTKSTSSRQANRRQNKSGKSSKKRSQQRRRRQQNYRGADDSDDDEEDEDEDSDEISDDDGEGSFGHDTEEEEEPEYNPVSGRAIRKSVKKKEVNYVISSDEDDERVVENNKDEGDGDEDVVESTGKSRNRKGRSRIKKEIEEDDDEKEEEEEEAEDIEDDENEDDGAVNRRPRATKHPHLNLISSDIRPQKRRQSSESRSSFLVKLNIPNLEQRLRTSSPSKNNINYNNNTNMAPRLRQGSRQGSRQASRANSVEQHATATASGGPVRRSRRISHEEGEDLNLTNSGRHVVRHRPDTQSPEIQPLRATRGMKGPKKMPSAIMEASQETASFDVKGGAGGDEEGNEDDDDAAQVQSSDFTRGQSEEQIAMEVVKGEDEGAEGVGVIQESVHEDDDGEGDAPGEEDDDDDENPVLRKTRVTRVSA